MQDLELDEMLQPGEFDEHGADHLAFLHRYNEWKQEKKKELNKREPRE
jgi:hypothetical protein